MDDARVCQRAALGMSVGFAHNSQTAHCMKQLARLNLRDFKEKLTDHYGDCELKSDLKSP